MRIVKKRQKMCNVQWAIDNTDCANLIKRDRNVPSLCQERCLADSKESGIVDETICPTCKQFKEKVNFRIAEVWLKQKNKRIDNYYDYLIPVNLSQKAVPGVRVVVPFGKGGRFLEGFITGVKSESSFGDDLREIVSVIDAVPVLSPVQCELCLWMHQYYCSLFYEALTLFTAPVKVVQKRRKENSEPVFEVYAPKRQVSNKVLVVQKAQEGKTDLLQDLGQTQADLVDVVFLTDIPVFYEHRTLRKRFEGYCLLAEHARQENRQAVILLPEIFALRALTPAFEALFGALGCVYSSDLKPAEKYRVFKGVQQGKISVVMGTRAALFLPYSDLSLIVMDEPDDSAYFARSMPRYDTLRVVWEYSQLNGAKIVLGGSALPLQIYHGIDRQRIRHFKQEDSKHLSVEMVDMQSEMRRGNLDFISGLLKQRMEETVSRGKKVLLMLNKRGAAGYMFCRQCGHVEKCSLCGISLKPYQDGKLRCPYCGEEKIIPKSCPICHSPHFKPVGLGVEKVTEVLKQRYPDWRILQIDARQLLDDDTLSEIKNQIDSGSWDVVIGTRVLLKAWSFKSVGLAAALLMDEALNHGDYNDSEKALLLFRRFFMLSEQYAIGQTYEPEHEVVQNLSETAWKAFYDSEMTYRKLMHYPPICHLVVFSVMDLSANQAQRDAFELYRALFHVEKKMPVGQFYQVFQPILAGIQPKTGRIRYKIMLKVSQISLFHQMTAALIAAGEIEKLKSRVSIEIDPGETV